MTWYVVYCDGVAKTFQDRESASAYFDTLVNKGSVESVRLILVKQYGRMEPNGYILREYPEQY